MAAGTPASRRERDTPFACTSSSVEGGDAVTFGACGNHAQKGVSDLPSGTYHLEGRSVPASAKGLDLVFFLEARREIGAFNHAANVPRWSDLSHQHPERSRNRLDGIERRVRTTPSRERRSAQRSERLSVDDQSSMITTSALNSSMAVIATLRVS